MRTITETVTLSGTGNAWSSAELVSVPTSLKKARRIAEVKVRQEAGGGATAMDLYIVDSDSAVSAAPDELDVAYKYSALALTASATALSLSDPVASGGHLRAGVAKRVAGNVTGVGAWTIYVDVSYEVQ